PGPHAILTVARYCGGELAEDAASLASEAASLAAALAAIASLAGVSVVAGAVAIELSVDDGAGASVFLPQALKMKAAAIALTRSLVFIYRYPKMF
ncbi:MAG TPA: hypothetical protein VMU86_07070, partial [Steroidobacteraceae bacterium]|nr:hypothetical protein [Steroidobacteraceae bacterium]